MLLNILSAIVLVGAPQLRIVVNIPAYRLDAYAADSLVMRVPIAVGMSSHPTPRGTFGITSVEWNPWWTPPREPWAAGQHVLPPGPDNPMGRVKLNFAPLYYVHGTPLSGSIASAASHGCIRLRNESAVALARIVEHLGPPALSSDEIALDAAASTSRPIIVSPPVPIEVRYDLVEIIEDRVFVYPDIYGLAVQPRARAVIDALGARGFDTLFIDMVQVRALVQSVSATARSAPIGNLLLPRSASRHR